jgi:hypothetical protein
MRFVMRLVSQKPAGLPQPYYQDEAMNPIKHALDECRRATEAAGDVVGVNHSPRPPPAPVMYTCAHISSSSPTSGGGFVGRKVFLGGKIMEAD